MSDWAPVVIASVLFILLSPGLLFQVPAEEKVVRFGNFETSGLSILVHSIIYFALVSLFLVVANVHWYTGNSDYHFHEAP